MLAKQKRQVQTEKDEGLKHAEANNTANYWKTKGA